VVSAVADGSMGHYPRWELRTRAGRLHPVLTNENGCTELQNNEHQRN
jgi:hypothetical protein